MDIVKGYLSNLGGFVTSLLDDQNGQNAVIESPNEHGTKNHANISSGTITAKPGYKILDWIPKLSSPTENAVVYYMDALASFGSKQQEELGIDMECQRSANSVIVDSPRIKPPPEPPAEPATDYTSDVQTEPTFTDWMSGLSSRTEEVWKQVKQDIHELVTVMSTEPKGVVARTASSVRQQLSAVADAARNVDPGQFSVLPESTKSTEDDAELAASTGHTQPPSSSDPPSLSDLRSDLSQFFSGIVSALFKPEESTQTPLRDRREARLRILRADPATYEQKPSPPSAHLGLLNYTDWRTAYFDEATCQPLPGIPLSAFRDTDHMNLDSSEMLAPQHPSPEQLLEANPFMRRYLSQLVRVEGQSDGQGITDADFWSRYYYRVWLLDATEWCRQRLVERVRSKPHTFVSVTAEDGLKCTEPDSDSLGWFSQSDTEDARSEISANSIQTSSTESSLERTSAVTSRSETETSQVEPVKPLDRHRKRRVKRPTEYKQPSASPQSAAHCSLQDQPSDSESCSVSNNSETTVEGIANTQLTSNKNSASETEVPTSALAESVDDIATSGSSSLVLLGNSDEEREFNATLVGYQAVSPFASAVNGIYQTPCVAPLNNSHRRNISEPTCDDWADLCGNEGPQLIPLNRPLHDGTKVDNEQILDDWGSWS